MLSCCRSRQKGHKKTRQKPRFQLVAENKKSAAEAVPKAKSKAVLPAFFARVRAKASFIVVILFILSIVFSRCSSVVQPLFACCSLFKRQCPSSLAVWAFGAVQMLFTFCTKPMQKPVRTAFAAAKTVRGGCSTQESYARRQRKNTPAPDLPDTAFQTAPRDRKSPRETKDNDLFPSGGQR